MSPIGYGQEDREEDREEGLMLRVKEAYPKDVGKGKVRISTEAFKKLNANPGDIVLIEKKRKGAAIVWHSPPGSDKDAIMMDGEIRRNAGASLNDFVYLRAVKARPAKKVYLAPVDTKINVDQDFERFIHARLVDRALITGNIISISLFGSPLSFIVKKLEPSGVVHITPNTQIAVSPEPVGELLIVKEQFYLPKNGKDVYEDLKSLQCKIFEVDYHPSEDATIKRYVHFLMLADSKAVFIAQKFDGHPLEEHLWVGVMHVGKFMAWTTKWEGLWTKDSPLSKESVIAERKIQW